MFCQKPVKPLPANEHDIFTPVEDQDNARLRMTPYEGQTCKNCRREAVYSDVLSEYVASSGSRQVQCRCPNCGTVNEVLLKPVDIA